MPSVSLRSAGRDFRSCLASLDAMYAQTNFCFRQYVILILTEREHQYPLWGVPGKSQQTGLGRQKLRYMYIYIYIYISSIDEEDGGM